ncbi:MAG: 16S rRNA (guanine(527)-N(7))-methyltransferase RsmG [Betaproteobacteria bacterium]|nr:16S rRNA (guanine(527)-N(7))-methyltransferase RsmG [Rhodocyclaceae bacterium]MCE2980396.1 16S rRNA (guanine(527)-N(7))-methyltransferase RsmG [Betaproteobacteria bacterium]
MPMTTLDTGLERLGLDLPAAARQKLLDYVALIAKWNQVHNLTAIREPVKMVTHHLLDSLALLKVIDGPARRVVDIGTGAGLPGIPLAIARPDWSVTLLDSNHKKGVFLQQAVSELGLSNATVVVDRVEAFRPEGGFDYVVSRAFSDLPEFAELSRHLRAAGGALLAMKGVYPYEEVLQLSPEIGTVEVIRLDVPGVDAERHLVSIGAA